MKKFSLYLIIALLGMMVGACSNELQDLPQIPDLQKASNLKADINGYVVNLTWSLPSQSDIEGVKVIPNGNQQLAVNLPGATTSYSIIGQPMDVEYMYTVKVLYKGGYVSEGVSTMVTLPKVELANVTNLQSSVNGRTVTLSWTLPSQNGISGVKVITDGNENAATVFEGKVTSCVLKGQAMDAEHTYTVEVIYEGFYASSGATVKASIPYITPTMGYLMSAPSINALPDDDERAAANWFVQQPNSQLIYPEQLADLDTDLYPVIWICIDRVGLGLGWENLPSEISNATTIAALKEYTANGGNLYLSNMATQLTVPLGIVPENMAPTVFGNGDGGWGDDVWVINPHLGWDFRNGADQDYYDRVEHAIFKGLEISDPNNYGYSNIPLIGPGQREDHNCLWDCNIYGRGNYNNVIKNFEVQTNSLVLATWGHVRDHCVAGLVEFFANNQHGRCIANGFAAYEFNQNSGTNIYQENLEKLTSNILDYLK